MSSGSKNSWACGTLLFVVSGEDESREDEGSRKAQAVVSALDTPLSQRPLPSGVNSVTPLSEHAIVSFYGPRFADPFVVVYERKGMEAPPDWLPPSDRPQKKSTLERIFFLVAKDVVEKIDEVFCLLGSRTRTNVGTGAGMGLSDSCSVTPYMVWHTADRDTLWRSGIVPITQKQIPSGFTFINNKLIDGGDANQRFIMSRQQP